LTRDRSALTKALPTTPAPGDSCRPRANTTSTGGQEADAFEINAGVVTGANTNVAASNAAVANLAKTDCRGKFIERSFMARY
jgi:hypothetical protein